MMCFDQSFDLKAIIIECEMGVNQSFLVQQMQSKKGNPQKIEIGIRAEDLVHGHPTAKVTSYCKVLLKRSSKEDFVEIGKTQIIEGNDNPSYAKTFQLDYSFECNQEIKFQIFHDSKMKHGDQKMGEVQVFFSELIGAKNSKLQLKFANQDRQHQGKLKISYKILDSMTQYLKMKWRAEDLYNTDSWFDFWDKSDPYLKMFRANQDNTWTEVYRTQWKIKDLNPTWQPLEICLSKLIDINKNTLKVEVWDWEAKRQQDQFIGSIIIEKEKLVQGATFELKNPDVSSPGKIILEEFSSNKKPSFTNFIKGGLKLNMTAAIDFTGSNGSPIFPTSLHYLNSNTPNQYEVALQAISKVLLSYDTDEKIPAFGFGAKTHTNGSLDPTSHCFPLSGNPQQVEAQGMEDFMNMYRRTLQNVELSGPTYFGEVFEEALKLAEGFKNKGSRTYQILLILTDGEIHDIDRCINLVKERGCNLPLSIIIVGMGEAKFEGMNRLDGDIGIFNKNRVSCPRDLVQFVPFRDVRMDGELLAKRMLAELPTQIEQYMSLIGKNPVSSESKEVPFALKKV